MSTVAIPTDPTLLFWSQTTTLDGVPYLLTFRYNSREQVYYLMIQSSDASTTYLQGVKLVPSYPLLRGAGLNPPGELCVACYSSTDDSPPALGELGAGLRCELLYIEAADVLAGAPGGGESWRNPEV